MQTCPWVSRSLWQRCGSAVACCRVGGTNCSSVCLGPFEGGHHYLHHLHHSLASGQTGREDSLPPLQQIIGLKIYWAWPRPSEQDPVSPSGSLSYQEASISLLSFSIRGQTENPSHKKLTNLITCRATQDGWVMVESSDKMWSTGEGNGKPLQYSCLENPMNSMKKQKDRTVKHELPRSLGAQYATGDQWRTNSRKNEEMEPSKNNTQLWMWLLMEVKSNAVKSNIA